MKKNLESKANTLTVLTTQVITAITQLLEDFKSFGKTFIFKGQVANPIYQ
jgi:hypothetical protein